MEFLDVECSTIYQYHLKQAFVYYMFLFFHLQGCFMIIIIKYLAELESKEVRTKAAT